MLKGRVLLSLLIGPAVPVPVPQSVLDSLTDVIITSATQAASGFQLTFTLTKNSPLETLFLLAGQSPIPLIRVLIIATVGGVANVLMDGVMTHHQMVPGQNGGNGSLIISGKDLSVVMNYLVFDGIPYPAMPVEARVFLILAKYAVFGVVPLVIPTLFTDVPIPVEKIPRHQGTDLCYLEQLAYEAGYIFYVDPGPVPGVSTAYWGPVIKVGPPQPALNINMDAQTNVESLSFQFNSEGSDLPVLFIQNSLTKIPIPVPIPNINPFAPPLGLLPPLPKGIKPLRGTAKYAFVQAITRGIAESSGAEAKVSDCATAETDTTRGAMGSGMRDSVTGSGSLDVLRYGRPLKARQLVGVRGAGTAFDGLYYVRSVTHNIKRGEYKQNFELSRNGLISTLPVVPT